MGAGGAGHGHEVEPDPTGAGPDQRRSASTARAPTPGTFDYFTDAINGKEKASRGDYTASEDDNVLVQGIANDPDALGYFGYAYYEENTRQAEAGRGRRTRRANGLRASRSPETIESGTYTPLSRPLFIYAKKASLDRPEVREFVAFYLNPNAAPTLIDQVGYIAFPGEYYELRPAAPRARFRPGRSSAAGLEARDHARRSVQQPRRSHPVATVSHAAPRGLAEPEQATRRFATERHTECQTMRWLLRRATATRCRPARPICGSRSLVASASG